MTKSKFKQKMYAWLRKQQQSRAASKIASLGYPDLFSSRPDNSIPCVMGDLWYLYGRVRKNKPSVALEFGSGCSTIIISQALADNYRDFGIKGHLWSLDADPYWGNITFNSIPERLKEWCTCSAKKPIESHFNGIPVWRHANVPDINPSFIYLDGPALNSERRAAVDVLDMEMKLKQQTELVVDGRVFNCHLLENNFERYWKRKRNKLLKNRSYFLKD